MVNAPDNFVFGFGFSFSFGFGSRNSKGSRLGREGLLIESAAHFESVCALMAFVLCAYRVNKKLKKSCGNFLV